MINAELRLDLSWKGPKTERARRLGEMNAEPLMVSWMKILVEGNRRGVLAGTDKDGVKMVPVKYRPLGKPKKTTARQRNVLKGRGGAFGGFGPHAAGLHNNLTPDEYRVLGGPPLAPRGANSRVITNFLTDYARLRPGYWQVTYWWEDVVSTKGVPFLRAHFTGAAVGRGHKVRLPVRDLRGIRPDDQKKIDKATAAWTSDILRSL